jgi:hypothetical protein
MYEKYSSVQLHAMVLYCLVEKKDKYILDVTLDVIIGVEGNGPV